MEVMVNRLNKFQNGKSSIMAFADIRIGDLIMIKGLSVRQGKNGIFVSMPRQKGRGDQWFEMVRALTPELKKSIIEAVLDAYQKE